MLDFTNIWTKKFMARRGPIKVFGRDVDRRERLRDEEAVEWFDAVWEDGLGQAVEAAQPCDADCVFRKLRGRAAGFVRRGRAEYREFVLEGCLFIAQVVEPGEVNQLWFVPSSSGGDPRSLLVKFRTMVIREEFEDVARKVGLTPAELAEQVLLGALRRPERGHILPPVESPDFMAASQIRTSVKRATTEMGLHGIEDEVVLLLDFLASKGVDKEELEAFLDERVEQEMDNWTRETKDLPPNPDPSTMF